MIYYSSKLSVTVTFSVSVLVEKWSKAVFTAHELNWTDLQFANCSPASANQLRDADASDQ